jgi:hypothetical protein
VTLNHPARVDLDVAYETVDGSALAGTDYESTSGRLVIPAGQTSAIIEVPTIDNPTTQTGVDRAFDVRLSAPPAWAGLADDVAVVAIGDDDPEPMVSVAGPGEVAETHAGSHDVTFEVSLDRPSHTTTSVAWRTVDGSAHSTGDYLGAAGVLTFEPGRTSVTIPLGVNGDAELEADETFSVELFDPQELTISDTASAAELTIMDDEPALVEVADQQIPAPSTATTMPFTISAPRLLAGESVTVPWSVSAPWQGSDPQPEAVSGSGQVELTAEHPSAIVEVTVEPAMRDAPQRFLVDLAGASSPSGREVMTIRGTGTVGATAAPDPVADLAGPGEVDEGTTATYRATASTGSGELTHDWDLDADGEYDDARAAEVPVAFEAFGARTIGLRVTDERGAVGTASRTVTVRNVSPAVAPLEDVEVEVGGTIRVEGHFVDPGANVWTASVDYGDGEQPVELDGAGFLLERTFDAAGVYGATVRVCDDGPACGEQRFTVTVVAPTPGNEPTIMGIEPDRGPASGGTRVRITGSDLFAPASPGDRAAALPEIRFGDLPGTEIVCERVGTADECSVDTPAHEPGAVAVTLVAPGGASATVEAGYRYEPLAEPGPGDPGPGDPGPGDPDPQPGAEPRESAGDEARDGEIAATGWPLPVWAIAFAVLALLLGAILTGQRRRPNRP